MFNKLGFGKKKQAKANDAPKEAADAGGPREFSEKDKSKARSWFKKAGEEREKRNYDYAIESYIRGLEFWPEAVDEGHKPLWALAIQRLQAGGKKPGMMGSLKLSMTGKDPIISLLNAEQLLAKDPTNVSYLDGVMKNAARAELPETLMWITPHVFDSMRKDKKPNIGRFKTFRQVMVDAGAQASEADNHPVATWCFEQAVNALDYLIARDPSNMALKDEQRDLSGKLTIAKGKYDDAGSFRESLRDADKQKLLHDAERAKQGEQTLEALIEAERQEYEANPTVSGKINAYVDALLKPERKKEDLAAMKVLLKAYKELDNYSFKQRADDVKLRLLRRRTRAWKAKATKTGTDEDKQQARLAAMEERQSELDVFRERVRKYPTDLRLRYRLGRALFQMGLHEEAIPMLQEATADPRSRTQCQLMIGRSFFARESYGQAAEVLTEALNDYDRSGDDTSKEMMYWIGRALEANGQREEARAAYGKLLRLDYNYAQGDARKRHDSLK